MDMGGSAYARGGPTGPAGRGSETVPTGAFHYVTQATTTLEQVASSLPTAIRDRLTARERRIAVVAIKLSGRSGVTLHSPPTATPEALYLDYRDLAALQAGATVPDVAETLEEMLRG